MKIKFSKDLISTTKLVQINDTDLLLKIKPGE